MKAGKVVYIWGILYVITQSVVKGSPSIQPFTDTIKVGATAPNFISFTPEEDSLSLNTITSKNKITLVIFWASWCIPCRAEMPYLRKLYSTYHDRGFEILGISEDYNAVDWNMAIAKDSMIWLNVSSLQGREDPVAKLYKINAIPAALLIDQKGKIVAIDAPGAGIESSGENLKGDELFKLLQEKLIK